MARVSVEIADHIAHVTLTRADKMNALDSEMFEAIIAAGNGLIDNDDVRAVVLSGEGKAFCAGLDVMSFAQLAAMDADAFVMPRTHGTANDFQQVSMVWRRIPVPVIAALHGVTFGGGFQIAMGADIRIGSPDLRMAVMEMKWGLIPDMGGMALLPRLVRSDVLRLLTYTAEPVEAAKALEWGLLTEISDDPLASAISLAQKIASKSPTAIRSAKRLIAFAESGAEEDAVLLRESAEQVDLIGKPHQMEVIAANLQKRRPDFK